MLQQMILPVCIVTGLGLGCGLMLAIAAKLFAVKVDETVTNIRAELPGANCGACGCAGCDEYAVQVAAGAVATNLCTVGGDSVAEKVSTIMGVVSEGVTEMFAAVKCRGHLGTTEYIMDYQGPQTCQASNSFFQGRTSCSHACLGFGDCVVVCQYDAIKVVNGVAVVDKTRCTGCGMCAKLCPNNLIEIRPTTAKVFVSCSSTDKGAYTRKVCSNGCIGCKKCEKVCASGAITVTNNLASIDTSKCTNCMLCVEQCPTKAIGFYDV